MGWGGGLITMEMCKQERIERLGLMESEMTLIARIKDGIKRGLREDGLIRRYASAIRE